MIPFFITIDTEGDDLWAKPVSVTTNNRNYVDRFYHLCQSFSFKPVWLVNWEVIQDDLFIEKLLRWQQEGHCEIGMHLHAWNSPPLTELTQKDYFYQPYLIDYPDNLMQDKIGLITQRLEKIVGKKPISHRAGRWAMDKRYFQFLAQFGYKVDCSVTPHINWSMTPGAPSAQGGSDYSNYSEKIDWTQQNILEVPMTIRPQRAWGPVDLAQKCPGVVGKIVRKLLPTHCWLRPNGRNLNAMKNLLVQVTKEKKPHLELMLHSSELMPGGSPYFPTASCIEKLYKDLLSLFTEIQKIAINMTLEEFYLREKQK